MVVAGQNKPSLLLLLSKAIAVFQTKEKRCPTASQPFIAEEPAEGLLLVDNMGR